LRWIEPFYTCALWYYNRFFDSPGIGRYMVLSCKMKLKTSTKVLQHLSNFQSFSHCYNQSLFFLYKNELSKLIKGKTPFSEIRNSANSPWARQCANPVLARAHNPKLEIPRHINPVMVNVVSAGSPTDFFLRYEFFFLSLKKMIEEIQKCAP